MKNAFWICLVIYLVGLAVVLGNRGDHSEVIDNLRSIIDISGGIALVLGAVLLGRRYFANANSQNEASAQAGMPSRQPLADGLTNLRGHFSALSIDKRLIAVGVAGLGAFFVASGFQTEFQNWAGQECRIYLGMRSFCFHPEWVAVGIGLVGLAVYLWALHRGSETRRNDS
jgi:hypothetical protein